MDEETGFKSLKKKKKTGPKSYNSTGTQTQAAWSGASSLGHFQPGKIFRESTNRPRGHPREAHCWQDVPGKLGVLEQVNWTNRERREGMGLPGQGDGIHRRLTLEKLWHQVWQMVSSSLHHQALVRTSPGAQENSANEPSLALVSPPTHHLRD